MKLIKGLPIWKDGEIRQAKVLGARGVAEMSAKTAMFWYGLYELKEDGNVGNVLGEGNVYMNPDQYGQWDDDDVAWDFIASEKNLEIVGEYVAPKPVVPESVVEEGGE